MIAKGRILRADTLAPVSGAAVSVIMQTQCFVAPCPEQVVKKVTTGADGVFIVEVAQGQLVKVTANGFSTTYPLLQDNVAIDVQLQPNGSIGSISAWQVIKGMSLWRKLLIVGGIAAAVYFIFIRKK